ncbi:MAG: hypothetical protein [Caudoviricetes sp.]|nr:MAG: hypothetical protein [Caudoviricetes sp.]
MNERIKEVIESLPRDTHERREACLDALYANKVGGKALEQLFDYWLWSEGEPQQEAHLAYVIALGEIEEALIFNDLVYQDRRSSVD